MSYNALEISWGGEKYIFITRSDEEFTKKEAIDYLERIQDESTDKVASLWYIPDDKNRKLMFLSDLRSGVEFCAQKYGVTPQEIRREATRIAPNHLNKVEKNG